jgi:hypothetical protein
MTFSYLGDFRSLCLIWILLCRPLFAGEVPPDSSVTVNLADGSQLSGKILRLDSAHVEIALNRDSTGKAQAPARVDGRSRYLYAPSSFNLKSGDMLFSQKELAFSTFAYGVTDQISLQLGSIIPLQFADEGQNALGGFKIGDMWMGTIGGHFGVQAFYFYEASILVPFAGATVARGPAQVSFNYAQGMNLNERNGRLQVLDLAGAYRLTPSLSLVSENLLFLPTKGKIGDKQYIWAGSLVARYHGQILLLDAGLIKMEDAPVPIPWVDFSFQI